MTSPGLDLKAPVEPIAVTPRFTPAGSRMATSEALSKIARRLPFQAKKLGTQGKGIEGWYPYYAGFSESFAQLILESVPLSKGSTVLDPWNGSGTTTYVADKLGFRAVGIDINPVAALVASAKLARPSDAEYVLGMAQRIGRLRPSRLDRRIDPLCEWLSVEATRHYRSIEREILHNLATPLSGKTLVPIDSPPPPLASFLMLALMRAARALASVRKSTNPTWIAPGTKAAGQRPSSLPKAWLEEIASMGDDLQASGQQAGNSRILLADARSLPLAADTIDLVLSSPPYLTRIDYAVNTSFELAALGLQRRSEDFAALRRRSMGTPLVRRNTRHPVCQSWPRSVRSIMENVAKHSSKASNSYYYKTYWDYFSDCELSLRELYRCLRGGAAAVLVVQSSYYKELLVDLPQLYLDMGSAVGFATRMISRVRVDRALSQINSRSTKHNGAKAYSEAVIAMEKVA